MLFCCFFFFKQKTAYEMRISDWSSDVCSSDLLLTGVDRTTRVVTQLLTLARLEPNAQPRHPQQLDLLPLCRECLAELTPLALARDQELTLEADDVADHRLPGDAAAIATLLQNLVGNALQYTPDGGQIQVSLQTIENGVSLRVDDSGPGVPAAPRDKMLDRFYRQSADHGAGTGLDTVDRIAVPTSTTHHLAEIPHGGMH